MQGKDLYQGNISVCFNQEEQRLFDILIDSIYPEIVSPVEATRIRVNVNIDPRALCIDIEISAYSLSQLRALFNSAMYLIHVILSTIDVIKAYTQDAD